MEPREPQIAEPAAGDDPRRITATCVAPDALGPLRNSRKGLYRLLRRSRRPITPDHLTCEAVASSAIRRRDPAPDYRPPALEDYDGPITPVREALDAAGGGQGSGTDAHASDRAPAVAP